MMQTGNTLGAVIVVGSLAMAGCASTSQSSTASLAAQSAADDGACGRLIVGHRLGKGLRLRSWRTQLELLQVDDLIISHPRESGRTRFKLTPGPHTIKARSLLVGSKRHRPVEYKVTIEPNTNHYLIYIDDDVWIDKAVTEPALVDYVGPVVMETKPQDCTL